MKKVFWFSRHELTSEQIEDLRCIFGEVAVIKVNKTINSAKEIKAEIEAADVVAVVMPLPLQIETLKIAGDRPVIIPKSHRIQKENGEFEFVHAGWTQIKKIAIEKEELSSIEAPRKSFR